jgi:hypothetical protein
MHPVADQPARNAFLFSEYFLVPRPTGKKAANLRGLFHCLQEMSTPVLRYHLWESRLALNPPLEYPNEFARWAAEALHDDRLAERLSAIDPFDYENLTQTREALADLLAAYLADVPRSSPVQPGLEFYFCEGAAVVMPSEFAVRSLRQFCAALKSLGLDSIYYHFIASRWRLGDRGQDDFSRWIESNFNLPALVSGLRDIDVYFCTLTEVRDTLLDLIIRQAGETCGQAEC